jgi:hypothetical protein
MPSPETAIPQDLPEWIVRRLASIMGADGRGGSGTFVELPNGDLAILTAKHVIIGCLLTGEITAGRITSPARTIEPRTIRIDSKHDVACVTVDRSSFAGDSLDLASSTTPAAISMDSPVIAAGIVGG